MKVPIIGGTQKSFWGLGKKPKNISQKPDRPPCYITAGKTSESPAHLPTIYRATDNPRPRKSRNQLSKTEFSFSAEKHKNMFLSKSSFFPFIFTNLFFLQNRTFIDKRRTFNL